LQPPAGVRRELSTETWQTLRIVRRAHPVKVQYLAAWRQPDVALKKLHTCGRISLWGIPDDLKIIFPLSELGRGSFGCGSAFMIVWQGSCSHGISRVLQGGPRWASDVLRSN
jgi:hypothetical protein